jgi:hypothetical protein
LGVHASTPRGVLFWSRGAVRGSKPTDVGRLLGRAMGFGAALLLLFPPAARAAEAVESSAPAYDLTVIVMSRPPARTVVALSYSRVIDEARLRAGIATLGERAGVKVSEVRIEEAPLGMGSVERATAAQFLAPGLVEPATGLLPVGAIVRALPEWEHMRIVFIPEEGFRLSGPRDASADGVVVRLVNEMEAYEYDVERMSGKVGPAGEAVPSEAHSVPLLPAIALAVPPGLLLGWLLADRRGRGAGA